MSSNKDQPKKNKTSSQKKVQPTIATPLIQGIAPSVQNQINDAIEQALTRFYVASKSKQDKIHDLQHLDTVVAEYLQSFMILGYDINGEKICITHATTPAARDALIEHLRSTFIDIMNADGRS